MIAATPNDRWQAMNETEEKSLALTAASSASSAVAELVRFAREGRAIVAGTFQEDVLEELLDAVRMVMDIEADFSDERNQLYGAIVNFLPGGDL